jgi:hypothetical protein
MSHKHVSSARFFVLLCSIVLDCLFSLPTFGDNKKTPQVLYNDADDEKAP